MSTSEAMHSITTDDLRYIFRPSLGHFKGDMHIMHNPFQINGPSYDSRVINMTSLFWPESVQAVANNAVLDMVSTQFMFLGDIIKLEVITCPNKKFIIKCQVNVRKLNLKSLLRILHNKAPEPSDPHGIKLKIKTYSDEWNVTSVYEQPTTFYMYENDRIQIVTEWWNEHQKSEHIFNLSSTIK